MAGMINQYNQQQRAALEKQRMKYRKHIKSLERDLAKSEDRNAHYHAKSEAKSKELKELQTASDEMADKIRELEFKLEASEIQPRQLSDKIRELEKRLEESECRNVLLADKIHELKTHYNKAITEQQDLYTRTKDLDRRIELLEKQLEEKDNEVAQQKDTIRVLSEKAHDLEASSTGFQALTAQNEEILQKISDQGSQTDKHEKESAKETHDKLDSISTRLDAIAKSFSTHPELITVMQETQTRASESITAKLNAIEESGVLVNKNTSQLSMELGTHMSKVWQRLDSQIETLTQQLAQRAEENGMLSALCKEKDAAYERLEQELEDLQNTSAEQIEDINALQERNQENQLAMDATREESRKHLQEILQRLQASEKEVKKFELEVMSKEDNIAKLGEMLKGKEEEYATRLQNLSAEIVKLGQLLGEKDRAAQEAVKKAVQLSLQEFKSRMEEAGAQAKKLVEEKQGQIKSLEVQLEELKKSLDNKEQNERHDACTMNSMRQALCAAEAKEKVSTEKLAVQCAKYDELEIQIRDRMNTVNTELEAAKRRVAEYKGELEAAKRRAAKFEDESHHHRARAQALFSSVREWARDEGLAAESFDQICDVNKTPEDLATGLSQALARMLLSQRSQVAHRGQGDDLLLNGNESQFNSANMGHPVLLSPDGSISAAHPELSGSQEDDVPALTKLPRRVVVRSPANDPDEPIPPSVSEEKARRRDGQQPKSIMKAGVARADQIGSVTIQDDNIEEASKDGSLHRSLADHSSSSSPGPLVNDIAPKASTPPGLIVQPTATTPKPELSGQNKRKRGDEPGPDIFLSRVRKPRASQMTEDIETETLAQLEEIVGSKRRAAKKRVTRTYGTQKPPESPPDNEGQQNILPTLQSEVRPQTRHLTAHQQTQGPSQPSEAQELPRTGDDSTGTQLSNNIAMEKPASSVRHPPLRRNLRRR
ncbi:hypothetical protein QBC42DRAFT_322826 [Cladorrhinum samala]|uniref:Uncharacterized protein n=1 Tax=Cladorrhinum samala TaxID=585594 RepID=A0AAV9HSQ2_9PEZI|nr:hypothetical protein QBC42DRAFT_322826 [Cladorrhinum samala]